MKNEITYLLHAGWLVGSPAYEMNPNPYGRNLALAVWERTRPVTTTSPFAHSTVSCQHSDLILLA